jgi:hypothetical protein
MAAVLNAHWYAVPATELVCALRFQRQQLPHPPEWKGESSVGESQPLKLREGNFPSGMIREDHQDKRSALDIHRSVVRNLGDSDLPLRRMMERLLMLEQAHAALIDGFAVQPQMQAQLRVPEMADD